MPYTGEIECGVLPPRLRGVRGVPGDPALMESSPGDPAAVRFRLAAIWQSRGRLEPAIDGYREAIALRPDYVPAHLALGDLLAAQGQIAEALRVFRAAALLNPAEVCFGERMAALGDRRGTAVADPGQRRPDWVL